MADDYRLQALFYRAAALGIAKDARVGLHFTAPNVGVEIDLA